MFGKVKPAVIFAAAVLAGCAKGDFETTLVIRPRVIQTQGSRPEGEPAYMARVYACYIGKGELEYTWKVASFADADAGIFTNVKTGERRVFGFMGEQAEYAPGHTDADTYISMVFSRPYVALVAVDPINRFYAYRTKEIPSPMSYMEITVRFVLWKPDVSFVDSGWTVVNGDKQDEQAQQEPDNTGEGG